MSKASPEASTGSHKEEEEKVLPTLKHTRSRSYPKKPKERIPEKLEVGGKRTKMLFKLLYHPEYLELGSTFIIADLTLHAFGEITNIFHDA